MTTDVDLAMVADTAGWIRRLAEAILQDQCLGHGTGEGNDPWMVGLQRRVFELCVEVIPGGWLTVLAWHFGRCSDLMVTMPAPVGLESAWLCVQRFYSSTQVVAVEKFPGYSLAADDPAIAANAVAMMPVSKISAEVSFKGACALRDAATQIEQLTSASPILAWELEFIRRLAHGDRVLDIAAESGYSVRSLYRALDDIWRRLGVNGRAEGIRYCAQRGWITW